MGLLLPVQRQSGWQTLALGAGGQLSNIDIASDGTMVVRADTYGAYWWDAGSNMPGVPGGRGRWKQLVSKLSMPTPAVYYGTGGCWEIRIAPSNTFRFYMYHGDGKIYRTDNRGVSWTLCGTLPGGPFAVLANDQASKFIAYKMAVDPNNADKLFVGTPANGAFVTTDAGTSWEAVSTVAASTTAPAGAAENGANGFAFYTSSVVYAFTYGTGIYKSTDGGSSWTLLNSAGMPTSPTKMVVDSAGTLYVADGHLNKYNGSAWSKVSDATLTADGAAPAWVAIKPTDPNKIFVGDSGSWFYSSDGGSSWSNRLSGASSRTTNDIPYLGKIIPFTIGNMVWGTDNNIHAADGTGHYYVAEADILGGGAYSHPHMISSSAGIEQLVVNWMISPPGGRNLVVACMDRAFFSLQQPNVYPANYGPNYSGTDIKEGFSLDWASSNPDFIVGVWAPGFVAYGTPSMATSSDGGRTPTWTTITNSGVKSSGGCVAALTPLNWVMVEANGQAGNVGASSGGRVWYTTDGGSSWNESTTPLGFSNGWYLQNALNSLRRQMVIADRVNGCFYMYNSGTVAPGFYRSIDGGANFSLACAGKTDPAGGGPSNFNFQMRAVPPYGGYTGGRFFATSGTNDDDSLAANLFYSCVDNGDGTITKTALTGVKNVWSFGYGKPKPGGSGVPTIFIRGSVDAAQDVLSTGGYGIWRTDDFGTSWSQLSDVYVNNSLDQTVVVEGDSNIYGRCYVGFAGSGAAFYDP